MSNLVLPHLIHRLVTDRQFYQQVLVDVEGALCAYNLSLSVEEQQAFHAAIERCGAPAQILRDAWPGDRLNDGWASTGLTSAALAR